MWFLYYTGMYLMVLVIHISSLWNEKSRQWILGRRLQKHEGLQLPAKKDFRIWFHVSSLGEFEQAKPVIECVKQQRPSTEIILSFFSPSGYLQRQNYEPAIVRYIPADLPGAAKNWINEIDPDMAVFVKYDLWPGFLRALSHHTVPSILISAHWSKNTFFRSASFPLTKKYLKNFKAIFLQRNDQVQTAQKNGFSNVKFAGDTRVDRTAGLPGEVEKILHDSFKGHVRFDLVAGSTWPRDEKLISHAVTELKLSIILAPHDVSPKNIMRLRSQWKHPIRLLSEIEGFTSGESVLIDRIGVLPYLYSIGKLAYIGGGFGRGIHNTLEPYAHGKAVIFGPHYRQFPEAIEGISRGFAFSVRNEKDFLLTLKELLSGNRSLEAGEKALDYIRDHSGATITVTNYILDSIPCAADAGQ